jgi:hypothetical protein
MKNIIILGCILFASCVTHKKVNTWLKEHPKEAAGYCADNFPPDTLTRTITDSVDTASYEQALSNMHTYTDSLFLALKKHRETYRSTPQQPCPPAINLDSLRKAVDTEMRKRLAPCKDTVKVITNTVVDRAREKQLQGKLDEKDGIITIRDKRISEQDAQLKKLKKWPWLFWLTVGLIGGYTFLKLKFKLPF